MNPRVTFLLNMLSPYWIPFYRGLFEEGWNVSIRVSTLQEPNRAYDRASFSSALGEGIDLAEIPSLKCDFRRFPVRTDFAQLPRRLGSILDAAAPDVVVSNQLGVRTLIAVRWGVRRGVPVIPWVNATPHSERANSWLRETFRRRLVADSARVFTNGTEGVRYVADFLGVERARIVEVPYAVSAEEWATATDAARDKALELRRRLGLSRLLLIYVGQMIPRKGLGSLVESFRYLPSAEAEGLELLAVGGDPPLGLRKLAEESPVRVVWHPFVQPHELPTFLSAADALVLPSLEDEWGIVLNEGAAAGLPLLASKYAGATADLVRDGHNGFVLDPLDRQQMTDCLTKFSMLDPNQRGAMAAASRDMARSRDLKRSLSSALEALGQLIASTPHQPCDTTSQDCSNPLGV
jgi:glycosyltransferase involved in cell wall biosynthesis